MAKISETAQRLLDVTFDKIYSLAASKAEQEKLDLVKKTFEDLILEYENQNNEESLLKLRFLAESFSELLKDYKKLKAKEAVFRLLRVFKLILSPFNLEE